MTDAELLAEIAADHGQDMADLVAAMIAGERGAPTGRKTTRAGSRNTRAGVKTGRGNSAVIMCGRSGRTLSHDPGGAVAEGSGRGPRG